MRVLLLGPYPPPHGGVQTNLVAIRDFLRGRGIHCSVINLTRFRRADADDVYYPRSALEVLRLLLRLPYGIIHLHIGGEVTLRLLVLGLCCCLMPGARTVLTLHSGGYPSSRKGTAARRWTMRGFVFRRFDRIIGVNEEIVRMFRQFGVRSDRIRLIPPHSIAGGFPQARLPEAMERFFDAHRPVLLTVGWLEPEYDLALQIDALAQVRRRFPSVGLIIVGYGSMERELRSHIQSKPYAEDVLLCGDLPHPVTLAAIARSDLFLRTTLFDGDSISVREALHLGTPVVATDNGMRPEGVVLIPPSSAAALCDAIVEQLERSAPSAGPRPQAEEENLRMVLDLYRELQVDSR